MTKRSAARATTNRVPHAPAAQDFELVESTYAGLTFVDKAAKKLNQSLRSAAQEFPVGIDEGRG